MMVPVGTKQMTEDEWVHMFLAVDSTLSVFCSRIFLQRKILEMTV